MLQLSLHLLDLCLYVNHITEWHGIFHGTDHEGAGCRRLLAHSCDAFQIGHLHHGITVVAEELGVNNLQGQLLFLCDVLLCPDGAYATNHLLDGLHIVEHALLNIVGRIQKKALTHDALAWLTLIECLPQFFCDERHERMEHLQQDVEEAQCGIVCCTVDGLGLTVNVCGLDHLQIPAGELVPEEFVDDHERIGYAVLREVVDELCVSLLELGVEPCDSNGITSLTSLTSLTSFTSHLPAFHQTEGIPDLIVEVTSLLAESLVEEDVVACGGREHHTHAHTIGTEFLDEFDGVGAIA